MIVCGPWKRFALLAWVLLRVDCGLRRGTEGLQAGQQSRLQWMLILAHRFCVGRPAAPLPTQSSHAVNRSYQQFAVCEHFITFSSKFCVVYRTLFAAADVIRKTAWREFGRLCVSCSPLTTILTGWWAAAKVRTSGLWLWSSEMENQEISFLPHNNAVEWEAAQFKWRRFLYQVARGVTQLRAAAFRTTGCAPARQWFAVTAPLQLLSSRDRWTGRNGTPFLMVLPKNCRSWA